MLQMTKVADDQQHCAPSIIHGPVRSRRFGRSLGVSLTRPGYRSCTWSCPYCQLSAERRQNPITQAVPAAEIQEALTRALCHDDFDVVTVAGAGEPSWHPRFRSLMAYIRDAASAIGKRTIVLSSGDGPGFARGPIDGVATYVKWDPGACLGAWCRGREQRDRLRRFQNWSELRIQAMLFHDRKGGNIGPLARAEWMLAMEALRPQEIHLTTVDRSSTPAGIRAVPAALMQGWCDEISRRLSVEVSCFPCRDSELSMAE